MSQVKVDPLQGRVMDNPSNGEPGNNSTSSISQQGQFSAAYQIHEFPKEFNKKFLKSSDWRYLSILLFSFIFNFMLLNFLVNYYKDKSDEDFIIRIQNHYASRFLADTFQEQDQPALSEGYRNLLRSASEWAESLAEETFDPAKIDETLPLIMPEPDKQRETSFEERNLARESVAARRRRSIAILRDDVKTIGLLGILTTGSGLVQVDAVEDILAHADSTAMNLHKKIENVKSLRVPRPGEDFYGQGLGEDKNVYVRVRRQRARRVLVSGVAADEIVENLAEAREQRVEKTDKLEDIPQETRTYAGLVSQTRPVYERRSVERIRRVVMSHNPAIQDCYRRELKENPELKGKITVRFSIDPEGYVVEAEIVESTFNLPRLENCIVRRIVRWNDFARVSPEQGIVSIKHTYIFGY
ncbi:MAG: AgmX/PglI C-terminal domain-containing protein [candidate division KSB1 bacterium]|nr:AgmX/PglI C-terminal domain-containing protein [candidate division KSB1 bacterium]